MRAKGWEDGIVDLSKNVILRDLKFYHNPFYAKDF
jgi:hypothetical protein